MAIKKILLILLSVLFAFSLAACSADGESVSSGTEEETYEVSVMIIYINGYRLEVEPEQNASAAALAELLAQGDITYTASDYGNFEKVGALGHTLPRNDETITTQAGDVILYQGNQLCLYYGVNTWSFTRIGRINGYSAEQLKTLLGAGNGDVAVTLSLS